MTAVENHTPTASSEDLLKDVQHHIVSYLGNDHRPPRKQPYYYGLALSVRDRLVERWLKTQRTYYETGAKRVYYLSMEFLPGRFLVNSMLNMGMYETCRDTMMGVGLNLADLEEEEWDPGLGNGGLGRLASCYLDSMATIGIPGYGCGIRYDYGIFYQTIVDGYQVERSDNWVRHGSAWEIKRRGYNYEVNLYGRSEPFVDEDDGYTRYRWVDTEKVMAMACDFLVAGYGNENANNMRLWAAQASREFNLDEFNEGDYIGAVEQKVWSENISKVLYPRDEISAGKELRLKQQYFFVAATFQDLLRRFLKYQNDFAHLPDAVAVQLNDTHPCIAIPELMRILLDEQDLAWQEAWDICTRVFAYTNHTVLPEALETWPVDLLGRVLPRHMEIIREIDRRFSRELKEAYPDDRDRQKRMAIVADGQVRMAHLAVVGSHRVNGVSALHTRILKERIFADFHAHFPDRLINITNGITPRRWLLKANPSLAKLITDTIGDGWLLDLDRLTELIPHAEDSGFRKAWQQSKRTGKERLQRYVRRKLNIEIDPATLIDVQVKRMHEYKRQLLNVLHVVCQYNRIKAGAGEDAVARTVVFGGKAAPGYFMAKLIIKLIHSVAEVVNADEGSNGLLKVVYLPNYCVSQAEKVIPAADLSEQISTAGMEASGTGNMKFALNGALTIGTLDGANVEILEEVGEENIFIFGRKADEVEALRSQGYNPRDIYNNDEELRTALDMIGSGAFSPGNRELFVPVVDSLLNRGDKYLVLADFRDYIDTQEAVSRCYRDPERWTRMSILNTANMGRFSSDRAVRQYAEKIWDVKPVLA
ncbi:MAG: glycogen/starch/alpha-glucan phosphorylase [Desulfobacterales bacterium]|nr:glycogen/starch/alpha-glucan phosphorylase [Desulfobacterales bacterium]